MLTAVPLLQRHHEAHGGADRVLLCVPRCVRASRPGRGAGAARAGTGTFGRLRPAAAAAGATG